MAKLRRKGLGEPHTYQTLSENRKGMRTWSDIFMDLKSNRVVKSMKSFPLYLQVFDSQQAVSHVRFLSFNSHGTLIIAMFAVM